MPTPVTQPSPLQTDAGLILEIGIQAGNFFGALVQPFSTDAELENTTAAPQLVNAFQENAAAALQACLSEDSQITFVEARGMVHGRFIPFRLDNAEDAFAGTRAAIVVDAQVAGLVLMYCGGAAPGPHGRLQIGKAFIPGLSEEDVQESIVDPSVVGLMEIFEAACCNGLIDPISTNIFYRVGAAKTTSGQDLPNVVQVSAQGKCATQRRRLRRN